MKRRLLYLLSIALLAACSAPKYTYNFGHYNYQTAKKNSEVKASPAVEVAPASELVASVNNDPTVISTPVEVVAITPTENKAVLKSTVAKEGHVQTKREIKKEVKQHIRSVKKAHVESVNATKAIDNDLKLAAIFGAVGIVALIIGGNVFWIIGGVALIIGVVFFIKWLLRQ